MPAPDHFRATQYAFTRHIRDPENEPAPADVEDRRMAIYRRLLFNNIANLITDAFPVLRKLTPDDRWEAMLRDYFKHHHATNPLFPQMPTEFLKYLEQEREDPGDPPWQRELAHYEWLKIATSIDPREIDMRDIDADGDLLAGVPAVSPLANAVAYQWPVHRLGPDFIPDEPPLQPSYLVIYRDPDDRVGSLELNPVSARLLELLRTQTATGRALLEQIAAELQHPDPRVVMDGGRQTLEQLRERSIVLGCRMN